MSSSTTIIVRNESRVEADASTYVSGYGGDQTGLRVNVGDASVALLFGPDTSVEKRVETLRMIAQAAQDEADALASREFANVLFS